MFINSSCVSLCYNLFIVPRITFGLAYWLRLASQADALMPAPVLELMLTTAISREPAAAALANEQPPHQSALRLREPHPGSPQVMCARSGTRSNEYLPPTAAPALCFPRQRRTVGADTPAEAQPPLTTPSVACIPGTSIERSPCSPQSARDSCQPQALAAGQRECMPQRCACLCAAT